MKDLITYNSHPWIMLSFNWLFNIWRGAGVCLKMDIQGRGEGGRGFVWLFENGNPRWRGGSKNFGRTETRDVGVGSCNKLDNFHGRHMFIISYWAGINFMIYWTWTWEYLNYITALNMILGYIRPRLEKCSDYLTGVRLIIWHIGLRPKKILGLPYWTRIDFIINWIWIDWMN